MNESLINIRYAKALLTLADELGEVDVVYKDIQQLYQLLQAEKSDFDRFIQHPTLKPSQKKKILNELSEDLNHLTIRFLELLIDNRREMLFKEILLDFSDLYRRLKGITTAEVTTASRLIDDEKENIKSLISKSLKTKVELKEKVDEEILGGFIIQIDDKQLDASVRRKLMQVRERLMNHDLKGLKTK